MTALALARSGCIADENHLPLPNGRCLYTGPPVYPLGNPGKLVGMMYDERRKQWVPVEAAAGLGNPGKIVGFNPDTGEMYYAMALASDEAAMSSPATFWALAAAGGFIGLLLWLDRRKRKN